MLCFDSQGLCLDLLCSFCCTWAVIIKSLICRSMQSFSGLPSRLQWCSTLQFTPNLLQLVTLQFHLEAGWGSAWDFIGKVKDFLMQLPPELWAGASPTTSAHLAGMLPHKQPAAYTLNCPPTTTREPSPDFLFSAGPDADGGDGAVTIVVGIRDV